MKKYISCANKFTNKATQLASKAFTDKYIIKKALIGAHRGEPMVQVFMNIINDPNVQFGEPDKKGNSTIYLKGYNVGWINPLRGMGWIDDQAYANIQKFDMSQLQSANLFDDDFDDDGYLEDDYDRYDFEDEINPPSRGSTRNGGDDDYYDDGDPWEV